MHRFFFEQYKEQFETELPNGLKCNVPALDNSNEELMETAKDTGLMLGFPANGGIVVETNKIYGIYVDLPTCRNFWINNFQHG